MVHKINKCIGITLWSWKRHIELWICLSGVEPHKHPNQEVSIIPLCGKATFYRDIDSKIINWKSWFHSFKIPEGIKHYFDSKFLVFINITKGQSAANNFVKI